MPGRRTLGFVLALAALALCPAAPAKAQMGNGLPVAVLVENMPPSSSLTLEFTVDKAPAPVIFTGLKAMDNATGSIPETSLKGHVLTFASGPGPVASPLKAEAMVGLSGSAPKAAVKATLPKGASATLTPFESKPVRMDKSGVYNLAP